MKLTFKDLKQHKFTIEAEPLETVSDVKAKIELEKGWDAAHQKLIYSGKILQDDKTFESYNIEEKGFIVCVISKPKPTIASPSKPSSSATSSSQKPKNTATTSAASSSSSTASSITTTATSLSVSNATSSGDLTNFNNPSALAAGPELAAAIANMESMGFPRTDIERAMRAAFYNPDRAVEYLLTGIPETAIAEDRSTATNLPVRPDPTASPAQTQNTSLSEPPSVSSATSNVPAVSPTSASSSSPTAQNEEPINLFEAAAAAGGLTGRGVRPDAGANDAGSAGNLEFLRDNPQFQQLRQLVQQQPHMLEPILQQLSAGNPALAHMVATRPEEFLHLLSDDGDQDAALPPGAQAIQVTEQERQAIERLCRLGFERDLVIQAYFACDKNEELAANFLFDQPDDGEEH